MTIASDSSVESVEETARRTARHLNHDHPVSSYKRRRIGTGNVRRRGKFAYFPRLWHTHKTYMHWLQLYQPLWLGEDGVVYREYVTWFGNSFFMRAEVEKRDDEGRQRIIHALTALDPCIIVV